MNDDDLFYGEREPEKKDTNNGGYSYDNNGQPQKKPRNALAIASLVTGLISLVCIFVPYFGVPIAIAGIVTAILSRHQSDTNYMSGMAVAGLVLSIIGLVLCALLLIAVIYMMLNPELMETIYDQYYDMIESMEGMGYLIRLIQ